MTVITLTTIGYGEIPQPLSRPGRVFTLFLALGGIFVLFYFAADVIRSVVTGELRDLLGKERMDDRLKHLDGHTIAPRYAALPRPRCDRRRHRAAQRRCADRAYGGDRSRSHAHRHRETPAAHGRGTMGSPQGSPGRRGRSIPAFGTAPGRRSVTNTHHPFPRFAIR